MIAQAPPYVKPASTKTLNTWRYHFQASGSDRIGGEFGGVAPGRALSALCRGRIADAPRPKVTHHVNAIQHDIVWQVREQEQAGGHIWTASMKEAAANAPHSFRVNSGPRHRSRLPPLQAYSDATPSLYLRPKGPKDSKILRRVSWPMKKSAKET